MSTKVSPRLSSKNNTYLQAYILLILCFACLLAAWLIHPTKGEYPAGVMIFAGAITPGILVLGIGLIEFWQIIGYTIGSLTPDRFITFMLSLWLPGIGLTLLGMIYLVASTRE